MSIIYGILAGLLLPFQTSINSQLRNKVGSPYRASFISFIISFLFLIVLLIITNQIVDISIDQLINQPLWIWLGGICGVIFLTGNILLLQKIGSVQTIIFTVLGQIIMGLIIDHFGFFYSHQTTLSIWRTIGALIVIIGVIIVSNAKTDTKNNTSGQGLWIWKICGIITGMLSATQVAVNGYLGQIVQSPILASTISFCIGTILLFILCLFTKKEKEFISKTSPWWIWLGGLLGGMYILSNVILSSLIGTGTTVIALLIGSTIGGIIVDHFGLFSSKKNPINKIMCFGILIMIIGTGLIRLL